MVEEEEIATLWWAMGRVLIHHFLVSLLRGLPYPVIQAQFFAYSEVVLLGIPKQLPTGI